MSIFYTVLYVLYILYSLYILYILYQSHMINNEMVIRTGYTSWLDETLKRDEERPRRALRHCAAPCGEVSAHVPLTGSVSLFLFRRYVNIRSMYI